MNALEEIGRSRKPHKCHVCGEQIAKNHKRIKRLIYDGDGAFDERHIHIECERPEAADEFPRRVAFASDIHTPLGDKCRS